tara:strand:- start:69 stop:650 length:582 start_codon:yes stop_codon:yes gene_type:complete
MTRHYSYIDASTTAGTNTLNTIGSGTGYADFGTASSSSIVVENLNVTGITTTTGLLDVDGGISISGVDENKVIYGAANGGLQDSGNLTFNGSTLSLTGTLGITGDLTATGGQITAANLNVTGVTTATTLNCSGVCTATTFKCTSTTDAFYPPIVTTTQMNAMTVNEGAVVYNTTTNRLTVYIGSQWKDVGSDP